MKKSAFFSSLLLSMLAVSCSTDLDVTGEWKEKMVVYGLLDQAHDTQYVKINKAFLGQGNAFEYAQIKDSVQFVQSLSVQLQRIKNGSPLGAPIILTPNPNVPKDPGTFYSATQANAIYSFVSTGVNTLNSDSEYKITIRNSDTGTEVTGQTTLVDDFAFTKPIAPGSTPFYFVNPATPNWPFVTEWKSSKNGRIYQLNVRFHYTDYIDNNGDTVIDDSVARQLDWYFPTLTTNGTGGGETMTVSFIGQNFLKNIGYNVHPDPTIVKRKAGLVDLLVTGGGDDLNTFIQVNQPSTSIVQEKPEYTNISNGLGIFSSRYSKAPFSRAMESSSLDSLACGQYTKLLKFENSVGVVPNCP